MKERPSSTSSGKKAFDITLLALRVLLGGLFLEAGLDKLFSGNFSAIGFLSRSQGPFTSFYMGLANNTSLLPVLNNLVIWGEILIGIALILGILVRFASFWGIVQMILYYTVSLPPSNGWISQHIIYIAVFVVFMSSGTGYFFGLDRLVVKLEEKEHPLRLLCG
jgi:thiosulfate dehydrogenase (quinone) large subunit